MTATQSSSFFFRGFSKFGSFLFFLLYEKRKTKNRLKQKWSFVTRVEGSIDDYPVDAEWRMEADQEFIFVSNID